MLGLAEEQPDLLPLFGGAPHGPASITAEEPVTPASTVPAWLAPKLSHVSTSALLERAPLDLRVNHQRASRDEVLAAFDGADPTRFAPHGVRLATSMSIQQHPLVLDGKVEVQDEGSQLVALACRAEAGMIVVDLCAGAGGKTLAVAAEMAGQGRLVACDTDRGRLSRLPQRAARAGAPGIEARLLNPDREAEMLSDLADAADVVLIDAPCSGTGTWRRNPESRWRLTPERLQRLTALQTRLIELGAGLVRPGGHLIYAVCSLLDEEGEEQIRRFVDGHPDWQGVRPFAAPGTERGGGVLLSPGVDGTDGFFVARLQRPCYDAAKEDQG